MTAANQTIADRLREAADLLEQQAANPFRVRAYREAVVLRTARWGQLERLRGSLDPERLFRAIPSVGPTLARRIHEALHVDTLEALEVAAHDGRLAAVPGIGPRRAAGLRAALAAMLGRSRLNPHVLTEEPTVALLLDVDRHYRDAAAAGRLPRIAPRRFNPTGCAWLPVLHTERDHWQFTVVFSNTGRAHELGKTDDWVIVYFHDDTHPEGLRTVVTETSGRLAGRRVVRSRESECWAVYEIPESSQGMDGRMVRYRRVGVAHPEARITTLMPGR